MLLFVYGTLMDADVRSLVLGRPSPEAEARPAVLAGWRRLRVVDEVYPALTPEAGGAVEGLLVPLAAPDDHDRVAYFEGADLRLGEHPVLCRRDGPVTAWVTLSRGGLRLTGEPWELEPWQRTHKPAYLAATREYMAFYGRGGVATAHAAWVAAGRGAFAPSGRPDGTG